VPESRIVADLLLRGVDDNEWRAAIEVQNALQERSPATARRQASLIKARLTCMVSDLWELVRDGSHTVATHALFAAGKRTDRQATRLALIGPRRTETASSRKKPRLAGLGGPGLAYERSGPWQMVVRLSNRLPSNFLRLGKVPPLLIQSQILDFLKPSTSRSNLGSRSLRPGRETTVIGGPAALLVLDLIGAGALAAALIYAAVLWRRL
jgi:hypothetical protein